MAHTPTVNTPPPEDALDDVIKEQESTKRRRKKLAADMAMIFHTFDRFVTMLRVYPSGHPLVDDFATQLADKIRAFCEDYDEPRLIVRLKAQELLTEWDEVFFDRDETERESFIWYTASSDGIIRFEFLPDVTGDELIEFMSVINSVDIGDVPLDDDSVTLLWERDLTHIEHWAIEGYIDVGDMGVFGDLSEPEAKATVMGAAVNPTGEAAHKLTTIFEAEPQTEVDFFTKMQVGAAHAGSMQQMPADMMADAFRVDTSWSADLLDEWVEGDNLEYRFIEALLSVVRTDPDSQEAERATQTIFQITTKLLDRRMFSVVVTILKLLHGRRKLFKGSEIDPLGRLLGFLSDPMRLETLIFQAQKFSDERDAIIRLLRLLDKDSVQEHILKTFATPSKEVRSVPILVDILLAITTRENERNLIDDAYVNQACYLERILPNLRGKAIEKYPILPRLMARAIEHESASVRRVVLELAHPSWCTPMVLDKFITPMMSDDDEELRRLAINVMREFDRERFERWLQKSIDFDELAYRKDGEVRFLVRLYLEARLARGDELYALLSTRGWFNDRRCALARNIGAVLLNIGDRRAYEIIAEYADSMLTWPSLREDYRMLLERFAKNFESEAEETDE